ncbi:hypothetical protein AB0G02_05030 [Actinosynnema sp. NPDC023658]|uniref:hypothetical protein n=1 Tax=Actinosynnema sp. NPDC023658 TaxID=3155465 RepID=UPI0033DE5383
MTTAVRLPDPFTPDATTASAATPTCCCCCCCAVSAVGGAIALPSGLADDLAEAGRPRRKAVWVLPATLFLPWVLASPFLDVGERWPYYAAGGWVCALLWTFVVARSTGAAGPFRGMVRLGIWSVLFVAEVFLSLPMLGVLSPLGLPVGIAVYALVVAFLGWQVHRYYARGRSA